MPCPYPLELRGRVLAAVDAGRHSQADVAARFGVSVGWVEKILGQRRRLGLTSSVCPQNATSSKRHGGGAPLRVTPRAVQVIRAVVTAQPEITLKRLQAEVQRQAGVQVSASRLWHWIKKLELRRLRKSTASQTTAQAGYPGKARHRTAT